MKIIDQSWSWVSKPKDALKLIEAAGRTCYKSESKTGITKESSEKFAKMLVKSGHLSVIEHVSASIRLITNRGVTHELVRHRLASFSQESTRYVRYDGDMEFIRPVWCSEDICGKYFDAVYNSHYLDQAELKFIDSCEFAENQYRDLLADGWRPEQAREVLPNSLKTEIVVTANLREWLHIFNLRCSVKAHPQIRELFRSVLASFYEEVPVIFDALAVKYLDYIDNRSIMEANLKACRFKKEESDHDD